jgi:hypothetical protein
MSSQVQQQTPNLYVSNSFDSLYLLTEKKIFFASIKNTVVLVQKDVNPSENTSSPDYKDFIYKNFVESNNTNAQVDYLLTVNS